MNIVVIYAHPKEKSLSHSLLQAFLKGARKKKHKVQVIDLYKEKFNPVLTAAELSGKVDPKVQKYQEMLKKSDWIVFIFPIWWFRTPTILEGFFDRVMTTGFAFKYRQITKRVGIPIPLLKKNTLVIETYGSPWWAMKLFYFDIPWRRLKRGVLKFYGVKKLIRFSCFSAPYASTAEVKDWMDEVEELAKNLK